MYVLECDGGNKDIGTEGRGGEYRAAVTERGGLNVLYGLNVVMMGGV